MIYISEIEPEDGALQQHATAALHRVCMRSLPFMRYLVIAKQLSHVSRPDAPLIREISGLVITHRAFSSMALLEVPAQGDCFLWAECAEVSASSTIGS